MLCSKLLDEYDSFKESKRYIVEKQKIINNVKVIKNKCKVPVYGVIKCDGYGMGLIFIAKTLKESGINKFGVSSVEDLITLRKNGFENEEILMLFSTCLEEELRVIVEENGVATVGSLECAILLDNIASQANKKVKVHIKIDTGMGRYGFLCDDMLSILKVYKTFKNIEVRGIYSHLSCSYCNVRKTKSQIKEFTVLLERLKNKNINVGITHIANSSAIFKYDNCYFNAVRIGSALVGGVANESKYGLERVGYLEDKVREIKWLPSHFSIGYGSKYRTDWSTKVAIIPIGTKDGFGVVKKYDTYRIRDCIKYICSILKRCIFNRKTYVEINNKKVPVLGDIGQNHIVVDITALGIEVGNKCKVYINPLYVNNNILKEYI